MKEFKSYYEYLKESIGKYKGDFDKIILYVPEFFKLLSDILSADDLVSEDRLKICAVLGYFVAPYDVIPEDIYGPVGYIDDLYLCSFLLMQLKFRYGNVLEKFWFLEEDMYEVLEKTYEASRKEMEKQGLVEDILDYIGLKPF